MKKYVFPVAIEMEEETGLFNVRIPDFYQVTCAETMEEAVTAAREVISLCLADKLENGEEVKSNFNININTTGVVTLVDAYPTIGGETYIKKTLTLPESLNMRAQEKNICFSEALVLGLKILLGDI